MKGHPKQPPETTSCLIVQPGWRQYLQRRIWDELDCCLSQRRAECQYDIEAELDYHLNRRGHGIQPRSSLYHFRCDGEEEEEKDKGEEEDRCPNLCPTVAGCFV